MTEFWSLPDGWQWKTVASICGDSERRNPAAKQHEYFQYVDISAIDNDQGLIRPYKVQSILGSEAPSRARKVIETNDVIFATTRPYLRNIAVVPQELNDQICSTGFCVLRSHPDRAIPQYVYYACRSPLFIEQLAPRQRGATYPAVADDDVYAASIPVPYPDDPARSLSEQRRIVARIEALFAELRECRALQQAIVDDTGRLMEAVLAEVFGELRDVSPERRLGDRNLCTIHPGQHILAKDYSDSPPGIPYITGPADFGNKYPVINRWTGSPKALCKPGDVLFTVKGSGVGKVNCAPQLEGCAISRQVMALRPNSIELNMDYLYYYLKGQFSTYQSMRQGAAIPGIRKEHVETISIPVPSYETQQAVVTRLLAIEDEIQAMNELQDSDSRVLGDMEQSILSQAFRGEL